MRSAVKGVGASVSVIPQLLMCVSWPSTSLPVVIFIPKFSQTRRPWHHRQNDGGPSFLTCPCKRNRTKQGRPNEAILIDSGMPITWKWWNQRSGALWDSEGMKSCFKRSRDSDSLAMPRTTGEQTLEVIYNLVQNIRPSSWRMVDKQTQAFTRAGFNKHWLGLGPPKVESCHIIREEALFAAAFWSWTS